MAEFKNPIDQLISDLGGTVVVAKAMGVSPSVVSFWRSTGNIPNWRVAPFLKVIAAKKKQEPSLHVPEGIAA